VHDVSKTPRRFSSVVIRLFDLARWLGSAVWPGRWAYRRFIARGGLQLHEESIPVAGLPRALQGLRIAQISDLHAGQFLDESTLDPVVDLVRACHPDVLVVTGDFITNRADDVRALGSVFSRLPGPLGKFAVFGNHDYRQRREGEIVSALRRQGVHVLRNASEAVVRGGATLRIVGLEDIEEGRVADLDLAVQDCAPDDGATLLLCHHPDIVDSLPDGRFDLVLCGHTHGGQIVLPWLGSPAKRWLPRQLSGTRALTGGGFCHVNRGLGVLVVPVRLGARAEVSCLTLVAADA